MIDGVAGEGETCNSIFQKLINTLDKCLFLSRRSRYFEPDEDAIFKKNKPASC